MPTVGVDGTRFHYEESGSGQPLVLVHETGGSAASFTSALGLLSTTHRAISYDRRGFGRTAAPAAGRKDYVRAQARDLACLLRELGATRVVLVGAGFGATIALATAAFYPDLATHAVLFDPLLHDDRRLGARLLGKIGLEKKAAARHLRSLYGDDVDASDTASVLAEVRGIASGGQVPSDEELARVRSAVSFVVGGRSPAPFARSSERLRARCPGSRLVTMRDADHAAPTRTPAAFVEAVREALR